MLEADLPLRRVRHIDFVSHHSDWCSVHRGAPRKCAELGLPSGKGGAKFLAAAAARGIDLSALMKRFADDDETAKLPYRMRPALNYLARGLHKVDFQSLIKAESATGKRPLREHCLLPWRQATTMKPSCWLRCSNPTSARCSLSRLSSLRLLAGIQRTSTRRSVTERRPLWGAHPSTPLHDARSGPLALGFRTSNFYDLQGRENTEKTGSRRTFAIDSGPFDFKKPHRIHCRQGRHRVTTLHLCFTRAFAAAKKGTRDRTGREIPLHGR